MGGLAVWIFSARRDGSLVCWKRPMRILLLMSLACFCSTLWVALALARHAKADRQRRRQRLTRRAAVADAIPEAAPPARRGTLGPVPEIFEAGEFREPRSLRLIQHVEQSVAGKPSQGGGIAPVGARLSDSSWSSSGDSFGELPEASYEASSEAAGWRIEPRALRPATVPLRVEEDLDPLRLREFLKEIGSNPSGDRSLTSISAEGAPEVRVTSPKPVKAERRQAPRTGAHAGPWGVAQRQDRTLYNKDMGDLRDPYPQPLRAASGEDRTLYRP
jgi:hypothetical protein